MKDDIKLHFSFYDNFDEAKSSFIDGINAIINGELFTENSVLQSINEDYKCLELTLTDLELMRDYVENLQQNDV
ncbi:hypothetical protein DS891_07100 [Pseudoalteromonas sp. JC28]|uniref:hypothetical protein n=1 Tax=Pseudoalteromonas sp. JC28 TaxID=2267617 RepID=UPI0015730C5C|nr:hypothetical protein [Pseudoalteromonas sp. JC28]NSY33365.1 hypothetical protein [Pseudoalteromonas sp. JC28]